MHGKMKIGIVILYGINQFSHFNGNFTAIIRLA